MSPSPARPRSTTVLRLVVTALMCCLLSVFGAAAPATADDAGPTAVSVTVTPNATPQAYTDFSAAISVGSMLVDAGSYTASFTALDRVVYRETKVYHSETTFTPPMASLFIPAAGMTHDQLDFTFTLVRDSDGATVYQGTTSITVAPITPKVKISIPWMTPAYSMATATATVTANGIPVAGVPVTFTSNISVASPILGMATTDASGTATLSYPTGRASLVAFLIPTPYFVLATSTQTPLLGAGSSEAELGIVTAFAGTWRVDAPSSETIGTDAVVTAVIDAATPAAVTGGTVTLWDGRTKLDETSPVATADGYEARFVVPGTLPRTQHLRLTYTDGTTPASITLSELSTDIEWTARPADLRLDVSPSAPTYGDDVTITATVTADDTTPTGTVTFVLDDDNTYTRTLSDGIATLTLRGGLAVGAHTVQTTYSGDSLVADTSTDTPFDVSPLTLDLTVGTNVAATHPGETVTVTARACTDPDVVPTTPLTLAIGDDAAAVAGTPDDDGCLAYTRDVTVPEAGAFAVTADFPGDDVHAAAHADADDIDVTLVPVNATLTTSSPVHPGGDVSVTVSLCPQARTSLAFGGTLDVLVDDDVIDTVTIADSGDEPCVDVPTTVSDLTLGDHVLTAGFTGLTAYADAVARPVTITVTPWTTTASGTASTTAVLSDEALTYAVSVSASAVRERGRALPVVPTGSVVLLVDGTRTGDAVPLTDGAATLTVPTAVAGTRQISAVYLPDSDDFLGAETDEVSITVTAPTPKPGESLTPTPEPGTPTPEPSTPAPEPSTPAPEPSTPEPEPSTPAPEPSTPEPEPSTPEPEPSTPAPEPSTPAPSDTDSTTPVVPVPPTTDAATPATSTTAPVTPVDTEETPAPTAALPATGGASPGAALILSLIALCCGAVLFVARRRTSH